MVTRVYDRESNLKPSYKCVSKFTTLANLSQLVNQQNTTHEKFSLFRELSYNKTDIIRICLVDTNIYCLYSISNTAILSNQTIQTQTTNISKQWQNVTPQEMKLLSFIRQRLAFTSISTESSTVSTREGRR